MATKSTTTTSGTPPYQKVVRIYRDQIDAGVLKPGDELPGRKQMMILHGTKGKPLARATVDKAVQVLIAQGLVTPRNKQRPIVADQEPYATALGNRKASLRATGRALRVGETSKVLRTGMTPCPSIIASYFGIESGEEVLERSRVHYQFGEPASMSTSYYSRETASATPELAQTESLADAPSGGSRELACERLGSTEDLAQSFQDGTSRLATDFERTTLALKGTFAIVTQVIRVVLMEDERIVEVALKVVPGSRPIRFQGI